MHSHGNKVYNFINNWTWRLYKKTSINSSPQCSLYTSMFSFTIFPLTSQLVQNCIRQLLNEATFDKEDVGKLIEIICNEVPKVWGKPFSNRKFPMRGDVDLTYGTNKRFLTSPRAEGNKKVKINVTPNFPSSSHLGVLLTRALSSHQVM